MVSVGCGGSSGSSSGFTTSTNNGSSSASISDLSPSKSNVSSGESFTVSSVVSASAQASYSWRQVTAHNLVLNTPNAPTLQVSVPPGTGKGKAVFELAVAEPGEQAVTSTSEVNLLGDTTAHEHNVEFRVVDDPDPTAGDNVTVTVRRKDGNDMDVNFLVKCELTMVLKDASRPLPNTFIAFQVKRSVFDFKKAETTVSLGQDAQPQPQNIEIKDLSKMTITIKDGTSSQTLLLDFDLPLPVGGTQTVTSSLQ